MSGVGAVHISEAWWGEACKKVKNAVVFLDTCTAESLHWSGGLTRLITAGAKNVKEFSSFECGGEGEVKGVFLVSETIRGTTTATILHDIIQASSFQYCVVVSSAHLAVQTYARYGGREVDESQLMDELEQEILTWMGSMNYTVEILYLPLVVVPFSHDLFFMPLFSRLYPLLPADLPALSRLQQARARTDKPLKPFESLGEVEMQHLPQELRVLVRQWVSCLHSLLQGLAAREEVFTLGHTARILGAELDAFPPARQRRKTASTKVSVVIMDRSLDLVGPASHAGNTLMARILALLPRLPGHHLDSAVNMAPLASLHPSSEWTLVPGCLAPQGPGDKRATTVLNALLSLPKKEALALLNKQVVEAAERKELTGGSGSGDSRVTTDNLKRTIQLFSSDLEAFTQHAGLLQQGLGVVEALEDPREAHLDQLWSVEKQLLQALCEPDDTPPITQVLQLLRTRASRGVELREVLELLVYVASLGGPDTLSQEDHTTLVNLLSHALVEDRLSLPPEILDLVGEEVDEVSALRTAQRVADRLQAISTTRQHLKSYREVRVGGGGVEPGRYEGLVGRLVGDCLAGPPHADTTDLEYRSAGLKDLIKTGFSLFVNVSKPLPRDAPTMLVWVVGGVTAQEVQEVRQVVRSLASPCQVVLASSHLTHPSDTVCRTLSTNSFLHNT